jgi:hypothetical protein
MKPLFNFQDPKFNEGFQINVKEFNFDQIEHCKEIFKARGVPFETKQALNDWIIYTEWSGVVKFYSASSVNLPLITYPELFRGAVQLEANTFAISNFDKIDSLLGYAASIEMGTYFVNGSDTHILYDHNGLYSSNYHNADKREISPAEFEAKLKGISPVARKTRKTENQSADNAQCKPKYFKSINSQRIVKATSEIKQNGFKGIVVVPFGSDVLGENAVWVADQFEPCEYPEPIDNNLESVIENENGNSSKGDFPINFGIVETVEQPSMGIDDHDNLDVFHSIEDIKQGFERLVDKTKNLQQENTQLKNKLDFVNPQLLSLTQANIELTKQVEELTQEVFDLKRNLSEPRNT